MRILDRLFVCLYLAIAALPYAAKKLRWHDHDIFGRIPPARRPPLTFAAFREETYQQAYTSWFESRLGFKGYAIATDNSILFHAFGETKPGSPVIVGKGGTLFHTEDIAHFNKDGAWLPSEERIAKLADDLAAIQTRMAAAHRALVPVLIPTKPIIYPEAVPDTYTRALGQPRPSERRIYEAFKHALDERKVLYIDARAQLLRPDAARAALWGPYARHWSHYAACLVMSEVAHAYTRLVAKPLPYDCSLEPAATTLYDDDFDLRHLLNIWAPPALPESVPAAHHAPHVPSADAPKALFIGTSFCWNLLRDASYAGVFASLHMDYYEKTLVTWPDGLQTPIDPASASWRELLLGQDLYVLDLFEGYLLAPGETYLDTFLRSLATVEWRGTDPSPQR